MCEEPGPINYKEMVLWILGAITIYGAIFSGLIYYYRTNNHNFLLSVLIIFCLSNMVLLCVNLSRWKKY